MSVYVVFQLKILSFLFPCVQGKSSWEQAEETGLGLKFLPVFKASAVFMTLSYLNKLFCMIVSTVEY